MNDEISEIRNNILVKQAAIENTKEQMTSIEDANYLDILEASKDKEYAKDNNLTNEKDITKFLEKVVVYVYLIIYVALMIYIIFFT